MTEEMPGQRVDTIVHPPGRRLWVRKLLIVGVLLAIAIVTGRQLTKERWHTVYSHPQPRSKLVLVTECPEGWEEDPNPQLLAQKNNSIWLHTKPAAGLLLWWQEHVLHQEFRDHMIMLTLMETDRPASKAENEFVASTEKEVDPAPTTTLTRHRLGPEIETRDDMPPSAGEPADASSTSIASTIYLDETPTMNGATIIILSDEFGKRDRNAYRIRKEIIRRIRVVKK